MNKEAKRNSRPHLLSALHTGHNFTSHIPFTADSHAQPLVQAVTKYEWSKEKTPNHIAAHIDHYKFGREDYGYGFGGIELRSKSPMLETASSFGTIPKFKEPQMPTQYKVSETDRFNPTEFE